MNGSMLDAHPTGGMRLLLRLPILLDRFRLDWLLGNRFLLLTHTGRNSGLPRWNVTEVVRYDRKNGSYTVASGWGEKSDWYRNIRKNPKVIVRADCKVSAATAEFISPEAAVPIMEEYARFHPAPFRELTGLFLGKRMRPESNAPCRITMKMPMVVFHPTS
jgi:deazaflavin-dependent oxidoreductase (nitroreductase family)